MPVKVQIYRLRQEEVVLPDVSIIRVDPMVILIGKEGGLFQNKRGCSLMGTPLFWCRTPGGRQASDYQQA